MQTMSESKNKKASKTTAPKKGSASTVQLDFLPKRVLYPVELESATEPMVVVLEEDEDRPGMKVPKTYILISTIVNLPTEVTRYSPEEWKEQMDSFRLLGIRQGIDVRPVEGGFWVEEGRHRILGAIELGRRYIKADIDTKGNAVSSALWRLEANDKRKGDRPIDVALGYKELMDPTGANLSQQQVAEARKVSAATVSRRLRLLEIPYELACLVGSKLDDAWLEPIFSIREDPALLAAASNAVTAAAEKGHVRGADDVHSLMAHAWTQKELAVQEDTINVEVRDDPAWAKARSSFKPFKVKVPARYEGAKASEAVYLRDVQGALRVAQEISDHQEAERRAEQERLRRKAAKQGKKVKTQPDGSLKVVEPPARRTVADRVPEERTKVQLDLMARFIPTRLSFPEEMMVEVLGRLVAHTGTLVALQDIEAACRALGEPVPEKPQHGTRSFRFSRGDFVARWKKNPAQAWHMVAVALYFQARDDDKQLKDGVTSYALDKSVAEPRLPLWLTGKTFDQATEIAKQAIKDRDAGYKPVIDGAACDHCGQAATLRREGVNVCRSEVFKDINKDPKALAAARLRRKEQANAAQAAAASQGEPAPATTTETPAPGGGAKAEPVSAEATPGASEGEPPIEAASANSETAEAKQKPASGKAKRLFDRKKGKAAAGA